MHRSCGTVAIRDNVLYIADFSGLLPNEMEGSIRLERPELGGQIVFGIDTSSSPFYVLTQPDRLLTKRDSLSAFLKSELELDDVTKKIVGKKATESRPKDGARLSMLVMQTASTVLLPYIVRHVS